MRPRLTKGASISFKAGGVRMSEVRNSDVYTRSTRRQCLLARIEPKVTVIVRKKQHS